MKKALAVLILLMAGVPGPALAQDRAAELEARQRARAERLRQRDAELEYRALARGGWLDPYGGDCIGAGYPGLPGGARRCSLLQVLRCLLISQLVLAMARPFLPSRAQVPWALVLGGASARGGWTGLGGARSPLARLRRAASYGRGCPPGYYPPYATDLFGYRWIPNPYDDWREIWGRGWTDGAEVPPYHRFQYRFFPETLPDPTRGGYITPDEWWSPGPAPSVPATRAPSGACALIRVDAGGSARDVLVRLPVFGAVTPEALLAVLVDRLQRGGGVAVRALDGYVFRFPPFEAIRDLTVTDC